MKKILVPIDFSPSSRNASEYAASLAKIFGAEVYLLHVFLEPMPSSEAPVAWMITGSELQETNDKLVNEEVNFLKNQYSVQVKGEAMVGYKGNTIRNFAKEIHADLVIMGMKKEKRSKLLGSTTFTAMRKSKMPVLVIPEGTRYSPVKYIILASDFDETSDVSCFNLLFKLAEKFDATVQVLHVQKKGVEMAASEVPGKMQLGRVFSKVSFWYQEIEDDNVEHGILNFIQSHPADLLVMLAHHHNIFERLWGTVHTKSLASEIHLPLLVLEER